jgi:glycosyltransferase involved in cell wall biosynthesis
LIGLIAHTGEDFIKSRLDFVLYLRKLGYDTFAIIPEDACKDEILVSGIKVYFYKYIRSWQCVFFMIDTMIKFSIIIKKKNPDMIFTYKFFPNIVGIYIASKLGIKKIIGTVAGLGFLDRQNQSILINIIFKVYVKILNKANYIIVQNSDDKNLLSKYIDKNKLVLTDGSGVNRLNFVTNNIYSREKWRLKNKYKYFLFCTRIVKEKGVFELIDAFNNLSGKNLNIGLIIAGWVDDKKIESDMFKNIRNNNNIVYCGYQKDVKELISLSDCVILPSYYPEGVPRSLIEALALSKPVITTFHKGCRETCEHGVNGYLVKPKDVKDIEDKILQFINLDNSEIERMAKASYDLFNRKFEQNIIFKKIMDNIL